MARVKIKHPNPTPDNRLKLLQILSLNLIYATKIITHTDGYVTLTRKEEDIDKVFSDDVTKDLQNDNFQAILPPEIRAKQTVLIFIVEKQIYDNEEATIKSEFLRQNP